MEIFARGEGLESMGGRTVKVFYDYLCTATEEQRENYQDCSLKRYKPPIDGQLCKNRNCQFLYRKTSINPSKF